MSTNNTNFRLIAIKLRSCRSKMRKNFQIRTSFFNPRKFFRILDQVGLNFNAINLKFVWFVDTYVTYNLCKFQIYGSKIEISTNFFILQKFFLLLIFLIFCFGSFWNKSVCFSCFNAHFWFVLVHLSYPGDPMPLSL